jgi:hypothetical protein
LAESSASVIKENRRGAAADAQQLHSANMTAIDKLLDGYDGGRLSRRELLHRPRSHWIHVRDRIGAASDTGYPRHHAESSPTAVKPREVARFLRQLVGCREHPPAQSPDLGMVIAGSSVVLQQSADKQGIDHFGVGVEGFDPERIEAAIKRNLPNSDARITADRTAVGVHDPNGILAQIAQK